MKIQQLRAFVAVAESGSLRGAARALGLSQPALSKSLAALETDLDVPLAQRTGRGVTLTPYGQALLVRARRAELELRRAREEISQMRRTGTGGSVSVAVSPAVAVRLIPQAVSRFQAAFPLATVRVVDGLVPVALPLLRDGSVDLLVGPVPHRAGRAATRDVRVQRLYRSCVAVVVRQGHPLAGVRSVSDLAAAEWVNWGPAEGPGGLIARLFAQCRLPPPRFRVVTDSFLSLQALLAGTDLVGALPHDVLETHPRSLVALGLREAVPDVVVGIMTRADSELAPLARAFGSVLAQVAAEVDR